MKKNIFIYLFVILLSSLLLSGCTKKEEEVVEEKQVEEKTQQEESSNEKENTDLGYLKNPEEFGKTKQTLGVGGEYEYTVVSIEESKEDGYHEFNFKISSDTPNSVAPLFTVEQLLDRGVLRVNIQGIYGDTTGISHTDGIDVNMGAVTGIYRVVTSLENVRIYDIGILANNMFKVELEEQEGSWIYSVQVAYDTKYSAPNVDFGSTQFSSDEQNIKGVTSEQGARITTYSYSVTGSVLKFVFTVASGASNPIPSVNAKYDESGMLVVTFESLSSDKVSTWGKEISLPSGVKVFVSTAVESSIYQFGGISGKKPFKLSASQSPNQVIVEIEL
jgi:hypothetical protein